MIVNQEDLEIFLKLQEEYINKYKAYDDGIHPIFPKEFDDIEDFGLKAALLQQALDENITLYNMDYIRDLHRIAVNKKLEDNIRISVERMRKK